MSCRVVAGSGPAPPGKRRATGRANEAPRSPAGVGHLTSLAASRTLLDVEPTLPVTFTDSFLPFIAGVTSSLDRVALLIFLAPADLRDR